MSDFVESKILENQASTMSGILDNLLWEAIIPYGVTDLRNRVKNVKYPDGFSILFVDGKPVLRYGPMDIETENRAHMYTVRCSYQYQFLDGRRHEDETQIDSRTECLRIPL